MKLPKSPPLNRLVVAAVYFGILALGLSLSWRIYDLGQAVVETTEPLSRDKLPLLKAIADLKLSISRIEPTLYELYATTDRDTYLKSALENEARIARLWGEIRSKFPGHSALQRIETDYAEVRKTAGVIDRIMGAPNIDWDLARATLRQLTINSRRLTEGLDIFVLAVEQDVFSAGENANRRVEEMVRLVAAYSVAIFLIVLLVGFSIKAQREAQRAAIEAQAETLKAQTEVLQVQKEKMTSLTQLVTNVAHEINTPIGAVKSSGKSIRDALDDSVINMPRLFEVLDPPSRGLFTQLISELREPRPALSTREERACRREVRQVLDDAGIENADYKAQLFVQLGAHHSIAAYLPLLRHTECNFILGTAQGISSIINSAGNINTAVDRVSKIVTTLKSFSQAESVGEMVAADLKEGIEAVLSIYLNYIKQGTELVRRYEELPPLCCLPEELSQVWTHLIHNALQAMSYRGTLTIALRRSDNEAVVSITDTGTGIPAEIRDRIFEPFFTTRPPGEGAGLGLDIVKKIVDRHKGRVDVQTEAGVGSTFSIYLPLSAPA
jgi:signal transduction histidine kinase